MNDLQISVATIDSREVAEMIEKNHADLLRDIRTYLEYLGKSNFALADFFKESNYLDGQNKKRSSYQITKKGCELIAHKMTGEKGTLFSATYINKFHEMEEKLQPQIQQLSPQLQLLINMELEQKKLKQEIQETKQEMQNVREVIEIRPSETWRADTNKLVKKICYSLNDFQKPKDEIYKALQERGACDLKRRLENMRGRQLLNGISKSKANSLNYLDVIAEDKRLIEIYMAIVKQLAIKYKVA